VRRGILLACVFAGCGAPDLVVLDLHLAGRSVLNDIASLHVDLFAKEVACASLDRVQRSEDLVAVTSRSMTLTIEERRDGADRSIDNLPLGSWTVAIVARDNLERRIGFSCTRDVTLVEGAELAFVTYESNGSQRPPE
jgi:hypothetical protein